MRGCMKSEIATREAYGEALADLGDKHQFIVLDADLSKATKTDLFADKYPDRFFNMGISEADMMGTAAGMAACGDTVFASTFALFAAGRAYEQIRNAIAYPHLNVKIGASHGGMLIGEDGASHQCIEDIALMRVLPGMTVLVPSDQTTTRMAVEAAISHDGPVYLRFNRFPTPIIYDFQPQWSIGKGIVLKDGEDVAIFAIGDMVYEALEAAHRLARNNVSAAVLDMLSVKPIDRDLVMYYASKTGLLITAEDHSIIGGLGSTVAEIVSENNNAKLRMVGVNDTFGQSGTKADLAKKYGLNAGAICQAYDFLKLMEESTK